jgi:hypothetical protein
MPIDPVAENTIEDENDAEFELDGNHSTYPRVSPAHKVVRRGVPSLLQRWRWLSTPQRKFR